MRKIRVPFEVLDYITENAESGVPSSDKFIRVVKLALRDILREEISQKQKEYLALYYYDGLLMREIAERCGVNISTVSRTVSRARKNIISKMKYYMDFRS